MGYNFKFRKKVKLENKAKEEQCILVPASMTLPETLFLSKLLVRITDRHMELRGTSSLTADELNGMTEFALYLIRQTEGLLGMKLDQIIKYSEQQKTKRDEK